MSKKKYTIEEIRNDPELKGEVCSGDNEVKKTSSGGFIDMIFDGIDAAMDVGLDAVDAAMDVGLDAVDAAMDVGLGSSKKGKK